MIPITTLDGARWRKASYSGTQGGNCVEVGPADRVVGIRDTKARDRGALAVSSATWAAFVRGVKRDAAI